MAFSKGALTGGLKNITGWLPLAAIIYSGYSYYSDRGIQGIMDDINAITIDGIKAKSGQILTGAGLIISAPFIAKYIPSPGARPIVTAIMYYIGAGQLFGALRSGAAIRGGSGRTVGYRGVMSGRV